MVLRGTFVFGLLTLSAAGCGPKAPVAAPSEGGVTCALNCSGVEETATAATEEAARAAVTARVSEVCDPTTGSTS